MTLRAKEQRMAVKVVKALLVWSILFGMQTGGDEHFYCDGIAFARLHAGACYSTPRFTTPLTGARNVKASTSRNARWNVQKKAVPNANNTDPWRQRQ